ncbi:translocator protein-like [Diabrotica undecimpunctata]|uniref:translocator protein-like n=1 Tax=Diabrotica undecimpunctata TaxID=50387 RepID=UPI003B638E31
MAQILAPLILTILPNIGGIAGSFIVKNNMKSWYDTLKKPNLRPPKWAFAPVWTTLYCLMGYASYLVYESGNGLNGVTAISISVYGINIIANWLWTPIFFGKKDIKLAFYDILLVDVTAIGAAVMFYRINTIAGYLMIPYCLWQGVATLLNYFIWVLNPSKTASVRKHKNPKRK